MGVQDINKRHLRLYFSLCSSGVNVRIGFLCLFLDELIND